jgi:hypothetical protein
MMFTTRDSDDIIPSQSIHDTWTSDNGTILTDIPLSINPALSKLIESPGVDFAIQSDCEGMVTSSADGTDFFKSEFTGDEIIKTSSLNDASSQLELLAVSPGVNFSLGCQGKDMVYSTNDLSYVFQSWEKSWTWRKSR